MPSPVSKTRFPSCHHPGSSWVVRAHGLYSIIMNTVVQRRQNISSTEYNIRGDRKSEQNPTPDPQERSQQSGWGVEVKQSPKSQSSLECHPTLTFIEESDSLQSFQKWLIYTLYAFFLLNVDKCIIDFRESSTSIELE